MTATRSNSKIVRSASLLTTALLVFCASGASCPQMIQQYTQPAPRVLPPQANLEQVFTAVNANSDKIHQLAAPQASISVAGFPSLRANIAMELPRRFRLKASTSLTGDEVDPVRRQAHLSWKF